MSDLAESLNRVSIIDTHEHISPPGFSAGYDLWALLTGSYVAADIVSAAMPVQLPGPEASLRQKWEAFRRVIPTVGCTSYFRGLAGALAALYEVDFPPASAKAFADLSERISVASRSPGWCSEVFRKAPIGVALLDQFWNVGNTKIDRSLFALVLRVDPLMVLRRADHDGNDAARIAASRGLPVGSFDEFMRFVDSLCEENVKAGAVCFKVASAYERTIAFGEVERREAERIYRKPAGEATATEALAFGDFVVHHVVKRSVDFGMPVQIHSGLQHGSGNILSNSNPLLLAPLFMRYPEARFDIFHGGYPFYEEAGCMAKNFPNVHLDMCWLPLISVRASKRALHTWLDLVPANKLHWGGDATTPEEAFGAAMLARSVVSNVLEERVAAGELASEAALRIGTMLLKDNSREFFKVSAAG